MNVSREMRANIFGDSRLPYAGRPDKAQDRSRSMGNLLGEHLVLTDYKMINDLVGAVFGYEHSVDQTFTKVRDVCGEFGVFHKVSRLLGAWADHSVGEVISEQTKRRNKKINIGH